MENGLDARWQRVKAEALAVLDHSEADAKRMARLAQARLAALDKRVLVATAVGVSALAAGALAYFWLRDGGDA